jgi:hypothetical protein
MALQHELSLDTGAVFPAAYARISNVTHTHNEFVAHVQWWVDAAARTELKPTVKSHSFSLPWQTTISLTDAYELLKDEPFFAGALDV